MIRIILLLHFLFILCFMSLTQEVSTYFSSANVKIDDALVIGPTGELYGSNFAGSNVYKIDLNGVATIFATGFNTPNGLAFDSQGNLFVCDLDGNRIYKLDANGNFLDTISVLHPSGILKKWDSDTMYFTQYPNSKLNTLAPDGNIATLFSNGPLNGPVGLCYGANNQLYMANFSDRKIFQVMTDTLIQLAQLSGSGSLGFITYAQQSIWATGFNSHKIFRIHPTIQDSAIVYTGSTSGTIDGPKANARFSNPNGIVASVTGDSLYVSDYTTGKVRVIDFQSTTTLQEKTNDLGVQIFPNPSTNQFYLTLTSNAKWVEIQLVDSKGSVVLQKDRIHDISLTNLSIHLQEFNPGTYILQIRSNLGVVRKRIIKI